MDYTKATNEQLETIIRYDNTIPNHLLVGVVEEVLNRNLLDNYIAKIIRTVIKGVDKVEKIYQMSMDDFLQLGRTKVYELAKEFDSTKGVTFTTFIYKPLANRYMKWIEKETAEKRDESKVISYSLLDNTGKELVDGFIDYRTNVERYVVNKLFVEQVLNQSRLSSRQKEVLEYRLQGLKNEEIAKKIGAGFKSVSKSYYTAIEKIRRVAI